MKCHSIDKKKNTRIIIIKNDKATELNKMSNANKKNGEQIHQPKKKYEEEVKET